MLLFCLLEKPWFKTSTRNFISVKAVCCLALYCCPAWRQLSSQTKLMSCVWFSRLWPGIKRRLGRSAPALRFSGPRAAGTQGLRAAHSRILRTDMNIQHRVPGRAPGKYPQAPAAQGLRGPSAVARSGARSPGAPRDLAPGPAAEAEAGQAGRPPIGALRARGASPREGEVAPQSRGRWSSEPPGETGGGLEMTRGRRLGRERSHKL